MEIINQQKLENNNKCKSDTYYVPYESFPSSLIFCTLDSFLITINIISYHNKDNEEIIMKSVQQYIPSLS